MEELKIDILVDGNHYTQEQLAVIQYFTEKHNLQEMIHLGAEVSLDGRRLSYDDINYLSREDASRVLIETKEALGNDGIRALYADSLKRSDDVWHKIAEEFQTNPTHKTSLAEMHVEGLTIEEYQTYLTKTLAMEDGERAVLLAHPDHFPTRDLVGLPKNEQNCLETMGMYGGPIDVIVIFDNEIELPEAVSPGYRSMIHGTSKLLDGTMRHDIAGHQMKINENGFDIKMIIYFPAAAPQELVDGHKLHLAMEFSAGVQAAYQSKLKGE